MTSQALVDLAHNSDTGGRYRPGIFMSTNHENTEPPSSCQTKNIRYSHH